MDETSYFNCMPVEIVEKILECRVLNFQDVCSFGATSTYFRHIANRNTVWKTKFQQTYRRLCVGEAYPSGKEDIDWRADAQVRVQIGAEVRAKLDLLAVSCRSMSQLSYKQFDPFARLSEQHPRALHFIIDELMAIVNNNDKGCNLTRKFYGLKMLRMMQQVRLVRVWEKMKRKPPSEQVMEEGAFFIGQWQYPYIDVVYTDIRDALDRLAQEVLSVVSRETGGEHPVCRARREDLQKWRDHLLEENVWRPHECKALIASASRLMFVSKGFRVRRCVYQNLPITRELSVKECDPLTISIIYEGVLRRLGVKCSLVSLSCHFLLGWSESYAKAKAAGERAPAYLIDVRNEGVMMKRGGCPVLGRVITNPSQVFTLDTSINMVECMAVKLAATCIQNEAHTFEHVSRLRSTLELLLATMPGHFNNYVQLIDFYDNNAIEIDPALLERLRQLIPTLIPMQQMTVINFLNSRRHRLEDPEESKPTEEMDVVPKRRHKGICVEYAIGLIMEHKQYGYRCVVYGWDDKCAASPDWMQTMRIHRLEYGEYQPFYNVLVEDGSLRYAAQENLRLVKGDYEVNVAEVGRYFVRWEGRYYEPTPLKQAEYPDDKLVREAILAANPISN